jgi:hypothetical protein
MMSQQVQVPLQVRLHGARVWLALCLVLSGLVGAERASRWAVAGVWRLARWRMSGGKWQRFNRLELRKQLLGIGADDE